MPLTAGARFGPYEVQSMLGAGGMGEVYRAGDSRLKRAVALKVLPEPFADDPERLARFRREAELLATISHPNIAAIHGLEESEWGTAIVLELVEGETLSERIQRGPLAVDEALAIARQIAEGLEAAHEKGVIHRDLKPANIKITPDGHVKILDFGLAKLLDEVPASASLAMSPTLSIRATADGAILGTAAYMSPEQARGRAVDRRTDIWAFGCVLFEMLTGRRAFGGDETLSDIVAAILKNDLEWEALPSDTPPHVRRLIRRCVQKDRQKRLPHIGLARLELEEPSPATAADAATQPEARSLVRAPWLPWAIAGVAFAIAAVATWSPWTPAPARRQPLRLSADLGADLSIAGASGPAVALSPDGSLLAFAARQTDSSSMLHVRPLDQLHAQPLPGTEGATSPFFSPDGRWIGFFADGKLKKVSIGGGAVVAICDAPAGRGGSWGEDDTIVFAPANTERTGLMRVSSGGGRPEPVTEVQPGEFSHSWPQLLPGGRAVLFTANAPGFSFSNASIVVQPLPSGPRAVVRRDAYFARYLKSGHLAFQQDGTLSVASFAVDRFELTSPPVPILSDVASSAASGAVQFATSDTGTLLYVQGPSLGSAASISWMTAAGHTSPLRATRSDWSDPEFAPDGSRLAFDVVDGRQSDLWIYEWSKDTLSRLTFTPSDDVMPVWAPDGSGVAFASKRAGDSAFNLYWQRADGSGTPQRLTESSAAQIPSSWHPSATFVAFQQQNRDTGWDIVLLPMARSGGAGWRVGAPSVFLNGPMDETGAVFSPDGHWIAYESTETGRSEVYVRPWPNAAGKWLMSAGGGQDPVWSRKAGELFYQALDGRIMRVSYTASEGSLVARKPEPVGNKAIAARPRFRSFDLHPDGTRFAVAEPSSLDGQARYDKGVFVFNFFDEVTRIAAGARTR
jgi:Tol biopolymer transport system component